MSLIGNLVVLLCVAIAHHPFPFDISDTITEKSVQEALDRLGSHRTVLVIAHRLGTIRNADNIIVLKDGVVTEQGTHDELLTKNGTYSKMWAMQLHSTSNVDSQASLVDESDN
jgi:ATP-binding cassette subfamily B protein